MKCPRCWAEKAYVHPVKGWKGILLDCLLLTHMKCHHCYHKFTIPWFFTFGKEVTPPKSRSASSAARSRRGMGAVASQDAPAHGRSGHGKPRRRAADAA